MGTNLGVLICTHYSCCESWVVTTAPPCCPRQAPCQQIHTLCKRCFVGQRLRLAEIIVSVWRYFGSTYQNKSSWEMAKKLYISRDFRASVFVFSVVHQWMEAAYCIMKSCSDQLFQLLLSKTKIWNQIFYRPVTVTSVFIFPILYFTVTFYSCCIIL